MITKERIEALRKERRTVLREIGEWTEGLPVRARHALLRIGIRSRDELYAAVVDGKLNRRGINWFAEPMGTGSIRDYGSVTHRHVLKWLGLPEDYPPNLDSSSYPLRGFPMSKFQPTRNR